MEGKTTELVHKEAKVVGAVREKITSMYDAYTKSVPLSLHMTQSFESILPYISSQKGKAIVESIRPIISRVSKHTEMVTTAGDLVLGVVGMGLGIKDVSHAMVFRKRMNKHSDQPDVFFATGDAMWKGFAKGIFGGILVLGRPITRFTDVGLLPIAKKIALWTDGILLRKEKQNMH